MAEWMLPAGDVIVGILLVATIVFAIRLNRRLAAFREQQTALGSLLGELNDVTDRAGTAIAGLKQASLEETAQISSALGQAVSARDELAFLIDRADALSGRLTEHATNRLSSVGPAGAVPDREASDEVEAAASNIATLPVQSRAEQDLMNAIREARAVG